MVRTKDAAAALKAIKGVPASTKTLSEFRVLWDKMHDQSTLHEQVCVTVHVSVSVFMSVPVSLCLGVSVSVSVSMFRFSLTRRTH